MTAPTYSREEVAAIAGGLSEAMRLALTSDWDAFCQCDWHDMSCEVEGFAERLEEAGFVMLDAVDADDLEQPFADDLGIVPGGSVWRFTPLGLAVRDYLKEAEGA
jgi:hypothetical protein